MTRVLVFGASGQLGTAFTRLYPDDTQGVTRAELDLTRTDAIGPFVEERAPTAIINASAYTNVDGAEADQATAMALNATAVSAMAETANRLEIPMVHVSTDYVFDGSGTAPHGPEDATAPLNVYGATKRAGEEAIIASGAKAAILRTSWVFSETGGNFVKTMLRLGATRDHLRIIDDQFGGPTPASDLAHACWAILGALRDGSATPGTYHYAGTPNVSWAGFAEAIFDRSGQPVTIERVSAREYGVQTATRPLNSRLDCTSFTAATGLTPADWRTALDDLVPRLMKDHTT